MLVYSDTENQEYYIDNDSKKIKMIMNMDEINPEVKGKVKNQAELQKLAEKELKRLVTYKDYSYDKVEYNDADNKYSFIWSKKINGIKTCDIVFIDIKADGTFLSAVMTAEGMFNDYENSLKEKTKDYIALDEAKEITELKIKNSETENGDLKNYTITESNLYFNEDKKLVWSMLIDIIYTNHQGTELILGREIAINANTKEVLFYR